MFVYAATVTFDAPLGACKWIKVTKRDQTSNIWTIRTRLWL